MSNKSLIDRVIDLEAGTEKSKKAKVCDPNIQAFVEDEWRYKAYRWYCLKNMILKATAIIISGYPIGGALIEVIRKSLG